MGRALGRAMADRRRVRPVGDHAVVQPADRLRPGGGEQERQQRMHRAGESTGEHRDRKAHRDAEMLRVAFTDGVRVVGE